MNSFKWSRLYEMNSFKFGRLNELGQSDSMEIRQHFLYCNPLTMFFVIIGFHVLRYNWLPCSWLSYLRQRQHRIGFEWFLMVPLDNKWFL